MKSAKIFAVTLSALILAMSAAACSSETEDSSEIISSSEESLESEVSEESVYIIDSDESLTPDIDTEDTQSSEYSYTYDEDPNDISEFEYTLKDDICTITRLKSEGSGKTIIVPSTVIIDDVTYTVALGEAAFAYKEIVSLILPDSITEIPANLCKECEYLTSVEMSDNVEIIRDSAFDGCKNLTLESLPSSIMSIGKSAFTQVQFSNTSITITKDMIVDVAAFNCCNFTEVIFEDGVTEIPKSLFNSNDLVSVEIPNSVTAIGEYAFYQNPLTEITIPVSVTSIGKYAIVNRIYSSAYNSFTGLIYGYTGTAAEEYAETAGATFVSLG